MNSRVSKGKKKRDYHQMIHKTNIIKKIDSILMIFLKQENNLSNMCLIIIPHPVLQMDHILTNKVRKYPFLKVNLLLLNRFLYLYI